MMKHFPIKFGIDLGLWLLALPIAFWLRLETGIAAVAGDVILVMVVGGLVKGILLYASGLSWRSWRRMGFRDIIPIGGVVGLYAALFAAVAFIGIGKIQIPRSVPFIEATVAVLLLGSVRVAARLWNESAKRPSGKGKKTRRVLIAGAGEAGIMIVREMLRHPEAGLRPLGFLDDDPGKRKKRFAGVKVYGSLEEVARVNERLRADRLLIAMPSQSGPVIRKLVDQARSIGLQHRILPGITALLNGEASIEHIREVHVEDLLRRDPVELETSRIASSIRGKRVLVTGAGGSIGAEIVRQVARYDPARIILVGRGENSIYDVHRRLQQMLPHLEAVTAITDVTDYDSLEAVFRSERPEVVFHAAAHKHVPLMESNPAQAVFNNVGGTRNVVNVCLSHRVERLVNISTDKAVNPTSVMGATKRVSELIVLEGSRRTGDGQAFVSVRFGNVLGSRGSVVPLFQDQIKNGGPVTVTHPDMERYFMTIPEASQLVLQAGAMAENGRVYVLDMGAPVKIMDLARDLIELSGFEPDEDIKVEVTGLRPGEKLFEEFLTAEEGTSTTAHSQVFAARKQGVDPEKLRKQLEALFSAAKTFDVDRIKEALSKLVPTYSGNGENLPSKAEVAGPGEHAWTGDPSGNGVAKKEKPEVTASTRSSSNEG